MFILNNLENLIFNKNSTDNFKPISNYPVSNPDSSNFHEILHQTINDASRLEKDNLQTYSTISKEILDRKDAFSLPSESVAKDLFQDRLSQETKQSVNEIISSKESVYEEPEKFSSNPITPEKNETIEPREEEIIVSKKPEEEKPLLVKENFEEKPKSPAQNSSKEKQDSLEILVKSFSKSEKKENSKEDLEALNKVKSESKSEKAPPKEGKSVKLEEQILQNIPLEKKSVSKTEKQSEAKSLASELIHLKLKEESSESDPKEKLVVEVSKEIPKTSSKEAKGEDSPKLVLPQAKVKESSVKLQSVESEVKLEATLKEVPNASILVGKDELSALKASMLEKGKEKKSTDSDSKEKLNSDNVKLSVKEFSGIEKEIRLSKETLVQVSGLDKSKWIIRHEKEVEHANLERKKESSSLLSEIVSKSSSSQSSSDSDKSFSNPRYDTNGFKPFSETLKTANADKPVGSGFDRENFSKSLNELVNKARINIVENGKNSAQISLYPKDLGKLTLNIDVLKEKVDGKILVESEFIKSRLLGDMGQLKADLKAGGLDLQSISIEVRNEGTSGFEFANPSSDKESSKENEEKANKSLAQNGLSEEEPEVEKLANKQYKIVDIKI